MWDRAWDQYPMGQPCQVCETDKAAARHENERSRGPKTKRYTAKGKQKAFSSIMITDASNRCLLHCLDIETKDRIIFVDQNLSMYMQNDETRDPTDLTQPDDDGMKFYNSNNKKSLDPENRELSDQEASLKSPPQPEPVGK